MDFKDTKVPQQRNLNKQNAKIPEAQPFRPIRAQRKLLPRPTPGGPMDRQRCLYTSLLTSLMWNYNLSLTIDLVIRRSTSASPTCSNARDIQLLPRIWSYLRHGWRALRNRRIVYRYTGWTRKKKRVRRRIIVIYKPVTEHWACMPCKVTQPRHYKMKTQRSNYRNTKLGFSSKEICSLLSPTV